MILFSLLRGSLETLYFADPFLSKPLGSRPLFCFNEHRDARSPRKPACPFPTQDP